MKHMETLGASNKKIKQVSAWQRSAKDRREAGVFIVEGIRMFLEAPKDWISEVYITPDCLEDVKKTLQEKKVGSVPGLVAEKVTLETILDESTYLVDKDTFKKISDTQTPQGVLTVLKCPKYRLEDIINPKANPQTPLLVVMENLQDPGNLGTILRVGEAAGVTGFIMSKGTVDVFNSKVVRSTMGSIYRMPFVYVEDMKKTIEELKAKGITTYAAHLQGSEIYTEYDYTKGTAFLIGNEGNGLTDETTALADKRLLIPMEGSVESLNAGVATAVLVYEAHRQRFSV